MPSQSVPFVYLRFSRRQYAPSILSTIHTYIHIKCIQICFTCMYVCMYVMCITSTANGTNAVEFIIKKNCGANVPNACYLFILSIIRTAWPSAFYFASRNWWFNCFLLRNLYLSLNILREKQHGTYWCRFQFNSGIIRINSCGSLSEKVESYILFRSVNFNWYQRAYLTATPFFCTSMFLLHKDTLPIFRLYFV